MVPADVSASGDAWKADLGDLRTHDLRHTDVALWIAAGAGPKEVAARAGHTSVSFTLDSYGHLYPEADTALRDRLDALYVAGGQAGPGLVIELPRDRSRPQRGPANGMSAAHEPSTTL